MTRVSAQELDALLRSATRPTILDVRGTERRAQSGWIPGSIPVRDIADLMLDPDDEVIVYCDCPNDASAAVLAAKLIQMGIHRVRPLAGGIAAWRAHGLPLDRTG